MRKSSLNRPILTIQKKKYFDYFLYTTLETCLFFYSYFLYLNIYLKLPARDTSYQELTRKRIISTLEIYIYLWLRREGALAAVGIRRY
jgi:hypothetical protein